VRRRRQSDPGAIRGWWLRWARLMLCVAAAFGAGGCGASRPTRLQAVENAFGNVNGCTASLGADADGGPYAYTRSWAGVVSRRSVGCSSGLDDSTLFVAFRSHHFLAVAYADAVRVAPEPLCHTRTELFTVPFDGSLLQARLFCSRVGATTPALPLHPVSEGPGLDW
jgi:hypothetical protein